MPARSLLSAFFRGILLAVLVGCGSDPCPAGTRVYGSSCVSSNTLNDAGDHGDDGGVDSSAAGDGDHGDGDADAGDGDGNFDASTDAQASPCEEACTGASSVCDPSSKECVECLSGQSEACTVASGKPFCLEGGSVCVGCNSHDDGTDPTKPVCDANEHECRPCVADADGVDDGVDTDCSTHTATPACFEGKCVECTATALSACKIGDEQYVCDPTAHTCSTTRKVESADACDECISNAECKSGHVCVVEPGDPSHKVCLKKFTGVGSCTRPRIEVTKLTQTADGEDAQLCSFSVTSTTCRAHRSYQKKEPCGEDDPSKPGQQRANDSLCGAPGLADGYCVQRPGDGAYICTVPCKSGNLADCPLESDACEPGPERSLCKL